MRKRPSQREELIRNFEDKTGAKLLEDMEIVPFTYEKWRSGKKKQKNSLKIKEFFIFLLKR